MFKLSSTKQRLLMAWLAVYAFISLPQEAQAQDISYFTISDIGNPHGFFPGEVTVGEKITGVEITAVDIFGDRVDNYNGPVYLSQETEAGIGRISPSVVQLQNGRWQGSLRVYRAGRKESGYFVSGDVWIRVTDNAANPHFGTSNLFVALPESFSRLLIVLPGEEILPGSATGRIGQPQQMQDGQNFSIEVYATDEYWNHIDDVNNSVRLIASDPAAVLQSATSMYDGLVEMSVRLYSSGQQTLTAFDVSDPNRITPHTSSSITVTGGELNHFSVDFINTPVVAGQPVQVTIRAQTQDGNLFTDFNDSVEFLASTGTGTVQPGIAGPFVFGTWSGELIFTRAQTTVQLTVRDYNVPAHTGLSNTFDVVPGQFKQVQVLLPGQSANPGISPGYSGSAADQTSGTPFSATVRAVDSFWNLVTGVTDRVQLETEDSEAQLSGPLSLNAGTANFTVTMATPGNQQTLTARDLDDPNILTGTSVGFQVNPGDLHHFQIDAVADQVAGEPFNIVVTARDDAGNVLLSFDGGASLSSSTGAGTLSPAEIDFDNGHWQGQVKLTKASETADLTCSDLTAIPHTGSSNVFTVSHNEFTQLQLILPGQETTPGIAPGRQGQVTSQRTGQAFAITVNAVDDWWNPVPQAAGAIVLSSTDTSAILPLPLELQSGSAVFSDFRFSRAGTWQITAKHTSNAAIEDDTSPQVNVISTAVVTFAFEPIASPQIAGSPVSLKVRAVDSDGTTVTAYNAPANLTASTGPGTFDVEEILLTDGVWQGDVILRKAAASVHINVHDFDDIVRGNSEPFVVEAGELARLQILLPGETATPGLILGKSGQPERQIAGEPFTFRVYMTDAWWNLVAPGNVTMNFAASDARAILPADSTIHTSQAQFDVIMMSEGEQQIQVQALGHPTLVETYTSNLFYVDSGQLERFVFTPIDSVQTAGAPFAVRIEAHNYNDNLVGNYNGELILFASTGNGTISKSGVTLTDGMWQGELYLTKADSNVTLYAADYVPPPNTHSGTSNAFEVVPDSLLGFQILMPGQQATPGLEAGRTDEPIPQAAGDSLATAIRAVDRFWNLISDYQDSLLVSASDSFAVIPDTISLSDGFAMFDMQFRAANDAQRISARSLSRQDLQTAISDDILITPAPFTRLLTLLPGEQLLPGDTETDEHESPGRSGTVTAQTSGVPFEVQVLAVDAYNNNVSNAPSDLVRLTVTDAQATISPADTTLANGRAQFTVSLAQGGNQVFRVTDESNPDIAESMPAVAEVLVGGLHYDVVFDADTVRAGAPFGMTVFFNNAIGERVASANHLVRLSAVAAGNLAEIGTLSNATFNLQAGQRYTQQVFDAAGLIRIKVEDDQGTEPAYSDPLLVIAGGTATFTLSSVKDEVGPLQDAAIVATLRDASGNVVRGQEVIFEVISGQGTLSQNSAISDSAGKVSVIFKGGTRTETNIIRASVDSLSSLITVVVNLTTSDMPDGVVVNYPNPFGLSSETTQLDYYLSQDADVTLRIFDLLGNLVWSRSFAAGTPGGRGRQGNLHPNSVVWDGSNDVGQHIGSGGYVLVAKAVADGKVIMSTQRKIVVLR